MKSVKGKKDNTKARVKQEGPQGIALQSKPKIITKKTSKSRSQSVGSRRSARLSGSNEFAQFQLVTHKI